LEFTHDALEPLIKTGIRWSILKCLHEVLCSTRLDMQHSINTDLEVAKSMIEMGCHKIRDIDCLLDWVESKLIEKAISLNNIAYWEDLVRKAKKGTLTQKEAVKVPYMEALAKKYEFLSYCIPAETETPRKVEEGKDKTLAIREEPSGTTVAPEIARARGYINMMLDHSEQILWVLVKLFEDLIKKDVKVHTDVTRDLRNCRTVINSIRNHECPDCDIKIANETVPELQRSLEKVKHSLMVVAMSVGDDYAKGWIDTIDKAERGELRHIAPSLPSVSGVPKFVSGLPRVPEKGWTRITLLKPIAEEKVEDISRQLGVATEFEGDLRIIVKGGQEQVMKAAKMIYHLQSENREMNEHPELSSQRRYSRQKDVQ